MTIRLVLKFTVPLLAALLLDRYCELRAKRAQRKEPVAELSRWEGEGGAIVPAAPRVVG
jgi:hypothetical protein